MGNLKSNKKMMTIQLMMWKMVKNQSLPLLQKEKGEWKLKMLRSQKKRKKKEKLLNITELAKLVRDFVPCLEENILEWLIKKLMLPEWLMKLVKQMELPQKTIFLLHPPRNPGKSKEQDDPRKLPKRQTRKRKPRRHPKPRKLKKLSKEKNK